MLLAEGPVSRYMLEAQGGRSGGQAVNKEVRQAASGLDPCLTTPGNGQGDQKVRLEAGQTGQRGQGSRSSVLY